MQCEHHQARQKGVFLIAKDMEITITLTEEQAESLVQLVTKHPSSDLAEIVENISRQKEWERWHEHCNTDCLRYRQGTCPFPSNEHYRCPMYSERERC